MPRQYSLLNDLGRVKLTDMGLPRPLGGIRDEIGKVEARLAPLGLISDLLVVAIGLGTSYLVYFLGIPDGPRSHNGPPLWPTEP